MKTFTVIWVLTASPHPWDSQQIMHSIYSTQTECINQAITEMVTDKKLHQRWDWQCMPAMFERTHMIYCTERTCARKSYR